MVIVAAWRLVFRSSTTSTCFLMLLQLAQQVKLHQCTYYSVLSRLVQTTLQNTSWHINCATLAELLSKYFNKHNHCDLQGCIRKSTARVIRLHFLSQKIAQVLPCTKHCMTSKTSVRLVQYITMHIGNICMHFIHSLPTYHLQFFNVHCLTGLIHGILNPPLHHDGELLCCNSILIKLVHFNRRNKWSVSW